MTCHGVTGQLLYRCVSLTNSHCTNGAPLGVRIAIQCDNSLQSSNECGINPQDNDWVDFLSDDSEGCGDLNDMGLGGGFELSDSESETLASYGPSAEEAHDIYAQLMQADEEQLSYEVWRGQFILNF